MGRPAAKTEKSKTDIAEKKHSGKEVKESEPTDSRKALNTNKTSDEDEDDHEEEDEVEEDAEDEDEDELVEGTNEVDDEEDDDDYEAKGENPGPKAKKRKMSQHENEDEESDPEVKLNQDDYVGLDTSNIIPRTQRRAAAAALSKPMDDFTPKSMSNIMEEDESEEKDGSDEAEF